MPPNSRWVTPPCTWVLVSEAASESIWRSVPGSHAAPRPKVPKGVVEVTGFGAPVIKLFSDVDVACRWV